MLDLDEHKFDLVYENLQPHQKKFWDTVENFLKMGVKPTPSIVNQALGKPIRTTWNGPLCRIRAQLLDQYGYVLVFKEGRFMGRGNWRWVKNA